MSLSEQTAKWAAMNLLIFILLLLRLPDSKGIIVITEGPSNITAYVGDSVTLPCLYTGTLDQPKWRVGTVVFLSSDPPAGYEYTNEGLRILSVWPLLNNTQFVCFFTEFIGGEGFKNTESHPGFITVKIRRISPTKHIPPTDGIPPAFSVSTSAARPQRITTFVRQSHTIAPGRTLYTSSTPFVASTRKMTTPSPTVAAPQPRHRKTLAVQLIGGITFGVGVSFLLVAIIIASTCLFLCRHAKQVSENVASKQEVKMEENPAYETPPSKIHMKKNEAYCTVTRHL